MATASKQDAQILEAFGQELARLFDEEGFSEEGFETAAENTLELLEGKVPESVLNYWPPPLGDPLGYALEHGEWVFSDSTSDMDTGMAGSWYVEVVYWVCPPYGYLISSEEGIGREVLAVIYPPEDKEQLQTAIDAAMATNPDWKNWRKIVAAEMAANGEVMESFDEGEDD
jgi:hypothetical protein